MIDRASGAELWSSTILTDDLQPDWMAPPLTAIAAYNGGLLIHYAGEDRLVAQDPESGVEVWAVEADGTDLLGLYLIDGVVLTFDKDKDLMALNASTGNQLWSMETEGEYVKPVQSSAELIFLRSGDEVILAVGKWDGQLRWRFEFDGIISPYPTHSIQEAEGILYLKIPRGVMANHGTIYAINIDGGELRWSFDSPYSDLGAFTISGDWIAFGTIEGAMHVLDRYSGERLWQYDLGWTVFSPPLIDEDTLYFLSLDGFINAVQAPAFESSSEK